MCSNLLDGLVYNWCGWRNWCSHRRCSVINGGLGHDYIGCRQVFRATLFTHPDSFAIVSSHSLAIGTFDLWLIVYKNHLLWLKYIRTVLIYLLRNYNRVRERESKSNDKLPLAYARWYFETHCFACPALLGCSIPRAYAWGFKQCIIKYSCARMVEWSITADCKSAALRLRRFESCSWHPFGFAQGKLLAWVVQWQNAFLVRMKSGVRFSLQAQIRIW